MAKTRGGRGHTRDKGRPSVPISKAATAPAATNLRQDAISTQSRLRSTERGKRRPILEELAEARKSAVLAYVTVGRKNLGTVVGSDVIRIFHDHLAAMGKQKKIDLLLITRGGNTLVPLRLNSLLREFADEVAVLVPYMAHSAGTLICLGADEIVMGAMGELAPVDPSVSNQFNPVRSSEDFPDGKSPSPRPRLPISVEDVTSYLQLALGKAGLDAAGMNAAFSSLTKEVHPLALGNIMRQHTLIRHLVRQLLILHMDEKTDKEKIELIIEMLTEKLYSHDYLITRNEAERMGLKVAKPSDKVDECIWSLFKLYEGFLNIDKDIDLASAGAELHTYICTDAGLIESVALCDAYSYKGSISRKSATKIDLKIESQGWERC